MSNIKVTEIFRSFQLEAKYTGVPSIFLRTFGCNMRCKNFGRTGENYLPDSIKINPEVQSIIDNIFQYKTMEELPLVETGCDSYPASYPQFKDFSPSLTTTEIVDKMIDLLPHKKWGQHHLVITGGEPLLWQNAFLDLLSHPFMDDLVDITFETNGTQELTTEFKNYLTLWNYGGINSRRDYNSITFSVSPKLSCSGELKETAIKPSIVAEYQDYGNTYLKFVISTEEDAIEALETVKIYDEYGFDGDIWFMPVGGVDSVYNLNEKAVAELALKHGVCFSPRLQISLFGNKWAT